MNFSCYFIRERIIESVAYSNCHWIKYRWTSLSAVFLSANSLIHIKKLFKMPNSQSKCVFSPANSVFAVQNSGTYLPRITRPTSTYYLFALCYYKFQPMARKGLFDCDLAREKSPIWPSDKNSCPHSDLGYVLVDVL